MRGGARGNEILEIDEETWDYNVERSLKPTYLVSRAALPHLIAAGEAASSTSAPSTP
jgi:NAD(P)-dependent dehydrogenase (short-subunit alcohol dehydrogenase family)